MIKKASFQLAQKLKYIKGIEMITLFGSAVKDEMHKKSDIDILIYFNTPHDPETGPENIEIQKIAGEIEDKYKLTNSF